MNDQHKDNAEVLKNILQRLHAGESADDVRAEFSATFSELDASEIARAEVELIKSGVAVEEVQNLCDVHAGMVQDNIARLPGGEEYGHPLMILEAENKGLEEFLDQSYLAARQAYQNDRKAEPFLEVLRKLSTVDRHYSRKENLMFPYLEKKGITAPPKVMWGVDDEIRRLIKDAIAMAEAGDYNDQLLAEMEEAIRNMITKENKILKPMLLDNLTDEDWLTIARESDHIGYAFGDHIEGASPSDAKAWAKGEDAVAQPVSSANDVNLPSGFFNGNELETLLNTLPLDITYVNADGRVQYFSEAKDRVFPRTRTIVGRTVSDCHPPKSVHMVETLIEQFKKGEKDHEYFWIQKGGQFILIRYYAVRDEEGIYKGVLEVTEEISELRGLKGNKTLMEGFVKD